MCNRLRLCIKSAGIQPANFTERGACMARIGITETVLRDAHQSLLATRMTTEEMLPMLPMLDKIGFHSLECWGGATFD